MNDFQSLMTEHVARKQHICSWCREKIEPGEAYLRYAARYDGEFSMVKLHPECLGALGREYADADRDDGWEEGQHRRGMTMMEQEAVAVCSEGKG